LSTAHFTVRSECSFTSSAGSSPMTTNGGCTTIEKSLEGSFFFSCSTCAEKSVSVAAFGGCAASNASEFRTSLGELLSALHPPNQTNSAINAQRKICFLIIKVFRGVLLRSFLCGFTALREGRCAEL